jgi:hypothetical protein
MDMTIGQLWQIKIDGKHDLNLPVYKIVIYTSSQTVSHNQRVFHHPFISH